VANAVRLARSPDLVMDSLSLSRDVVVFIVTVGIVEVGSYDG